MYYGTTSLEHPGSVADIWAYRQYLPKRRIDERKGALDVLVVLLPGCRLHIWLLARTQDRRADLLVPT